MKLPISNAARVVFITAIPMLFFVNTILADFCWRFHVRNISTNCTKKHMSHLAILTVTQILANKIVIKTFLTVTIEIQD